MLNSKFKHIFLKSLPLISFIIPFLILYFYQGIAYPPYPYYIYPSDIYTDTFETMWKGRAFYIFFVWFATLEMVLSWEKLQSKISIEESVRITAFIFAFSLPTVYIIISNFCGLNKLIVDWAWRINIAQPDWMPLAIEHLVFAVLFILIVFLQYGVNGSKNLLFSPILLVIIGILYTIDNVFPYGRFMPLQTLTPTTAILAEVILRTMGYKTYIRYETTPKYGWAPLLTAWDPQDPRRYAAFYIAWPCSGIESLIIYTLFMLLFLRNINLTRLQRATYFIIGAAITYLINILRIVIIFILAINFGPNSPQVHRFHDYYAQLISILWIALYPLIVNASRGVWVKIKSFIGVLF